MCLYQLLVPQANTNTQQYTAAQHHFSKILFTTFVLAKCALKHLKLPKKQPEQGEAEERDAKLC